ncbi:MAG: hypothetical protein ACPL0A_01885, partial [Candidatus Micrarchaeia archaeon]
RNELLWCSFLRQPKERCSQKGSAMVKTLPLHLSLAVRSLRPRNVSKVEIPCSIQGGPIFMYSDV